MRNLMKNALKLVLFGLAWAVYFVLPLWIDFYLPEATKNYLNRNPLKRKLHA